MSAGPKPRFGQGRRQSGVRGQGRVAAHLAGDRLGPRSRRVIVKSRLVVLARAAPGSAAAHLRYITRDGVTPDGAPGQVYGAATDRADGEAFIERGKADRHQFRFIVSPEDAQDLGDLRAFTRRLTAQAEADLGTRLDWIAVDHHDTDNPHTHLMIRGVNDQGRDLVIDSDYITHGLRHRACRLATDLLGPQTDQELAARLDREVTAERWTGLDRRLAERARDGVVALGKPRDLAERRLRSRLQTLERLGLAEDRGRDGFRLRDDVERTLRAMGERGDIIRTMQRAFAGQAPPLEIVHPGAPGAAIGRIVGKGLADELEDRGHLVLDSLDGKGRYVVLPPDTDLAAYRIGAVVEVRGVAAGPRPADRAVAGLAEQGVYQPSRHLQRAQAEGRSADPAALVQAHVRRLEVLRRSGMVERIDADRWRLPADFLDQAARYEAGRLGGVRVDILADRPPAKLARALGATWLDRALIDGAKPAPAGFGAEVQAALAARRDFLLEQGLARKDGDKVLLGRNLLARLRGREMATVGARIAAETGLTYHPAEDGEVRGTYRRSLALVSGRFAMIDNGLGFSLAPWRPVLEQRLGQTVSGVMKAGGVDWQVGRGRGVSV